MKSGVVRLFRPKSVDLLKEIALGFFSRDAENAWHAGVVIAGYGNKDMFPGLISFLTEGSFDGKLKLLPDEEAFIDHDNDASLNPFAQRRMVNTFMEGIDPELRRRVSDFVEMGTELIVSAFLHGRFRAHSVFD